MTLRSGDAHLGAHPPQVSQDPADLALAARYAPRILHDQNEPFLPLVVGYTIFRDDGYSPSFPRYVGFRPIGRTPAALAVEYAIWWDWDIGHLYELEHFWTFIAEGGAVVHSEGSWHGDFHTVWRWNSRNALLHEETHPVAFAQPGKHAFTGDVRLFQVMADYVRESCNARAGAGGLCVTDIFTDVLTAYKTRENDALVQAYLKPRAFEPSFEWNKIFDVTPDVLIPWPALRKWIPQRIDFVLKCLKTGKEIT